MKPIHSNALFILALGIAGGLCGTGARMWIGGLRPQHAQLERCILSSRGSGPQADARSMLARLDTEVPACMNAAGYERALGNENCSPTFWQGDVFCYLPKSSLGRFIYRIEASSAAKRMRDESKNASPPSEG